MRIYIAGVFTTLRNIYEYPDMTIRQNIGDYPHMLESFHYARKANDGTAHVLRRYKMKVFMDSGAFSAFNIGSEIKLDEYAAFLNRYPDIVEFTANLDDLSRDKALAAKNSWDKLKELEKQVPKGMYVVPVYHVREPFEYLRRMVEQYPFIAIGGMVPESTKDLYHLLDEIWDSILTDKHGKPRCRVHGFGLTTVDLMLRYPWWSVDSTTWIMNGAFGGINIMTKDGKAIRVHVSGKSPKKKDIDAHLDTMPALQRRQVEEIIAAKGFRLDQLQTDGTQGLLSRGAFNVTFYRDLMGMNAQTFKKQIGHLL